MSASTDTREVKAVDMTTPMQTGRSSSVDRLDEDVPYEPSSLQQSKFSSRSETDLVVSLRDGTPFHEDVVRQKAAIFGGQVVRRRTRPVENHLDSSADHLHKVEVSSTPEAEKKPSSAVTQPDAETIPSAPSYIRPNYSNRMGAPQVQSSSVNAISKYGRPEEQPSSSQVAQKPAQSASASTAVSKPVVSKVEGKDRDATSRPPQRSSTIDDDDSVVKSFEEWKTRRQTGSKQAPRTSDEKPSWTAEMHVNSANITDTSRGLNQQQEIESAKPTSSEPSSSSIFGVTLRHRAASKLEDQQVKPHSEDAEIKPSDFESPLSSAQPMSAVHVGASQLVKPDKETLVDLPKDDVSKGRDVEVSTSDVSGRRWSLEAEVPHFPKDSVMLTGGHLSMSPRSSTDETHLQSPPSFHDVKTDDQMDDSVFEKDSVHVKHSSLQTDTVCVPLAGEEPATASVNTPSVDYLLSSETNR